VWRRVHTHCVCARVYVRTDGHVALSEGNCKYLARLGGVVDAPCCLRIRSYVEKAYGFTLFNVTSQLPAAVTADVLSMSPQTHVSGHGCVLKPF
jgi:hypothetical protein